MQSMTIGTSSRSSISASNATSAGSRPSASPSSASDRPAQSGMAGRVRDADAAPARVGGRRSPSPRCRARSRPGPGRARRGRPARRRTRRRRGPSSAGGRIVASVVAAAVYGYWSAATSRPSARAASSTAIASAARPHTARDAALEVRDLEPRSLDTRRRPRPGPPRSTRRARRTARSASLRMCVAYRPPRRVAAVASARDLVGFGVHPRRVDQPRGQPERAGIHRRLDLDGPSRAARGRSRPAPPRR